LDRRSKGRVLLKSTGGLRESSEVFEFEVYIKGSTDWGAAMRSEGPEFPDYEANFKAVNDTGKVARGGEKDSGELHPQTSVGLGAVFKKFIWHGGSVYDAWSNAVSAQVSARHIEFINLPGPFACN
jgi:hypothetical protein